MKHIENNLPEQGVVTGKFQIAPPTIQTFRSLSRKFHVPCPKPPALKGLKNRPHTNAWQIVQSQVKRAIDQLLLTIFTKLPEPECPLPRTRKPNSHRQEAV